MTKEIKIDAKGQKLGRLATKIAIVLNGKDSPDFAPNKVADVRVVVENVNALDISQSALDNKEHQRYSGYPGGRRVLKWKEVVDKKGFAELLRVAVKGMLPKNKLQERRLKNLIIK